MEKYSNAPHEAFSKVATTLLSTVWRDPNPTKPSNRAHCRCPCAFYPILREGSGRRVLDWVARTSDVPISHRFSRSGRVVELYWTSALGTRRYRIRKTRIHSTAENCQLSTLRLGFCNTIHGQTPYFEQGISSRTAQPELSRSGFGPTLVISTSSCSTSNDIWKASSSHTHPHALFFKLATNKNKTRSLNIYHLSPTYPSRLLLTKQMCFPPFTRQTGHAPRCGTGAYALYCW